MKFKLKGFENNETVEESITIEKYRNGVIGIMLPNSKDGAVLFIDGKNKVIRFYDNCLGDFTFEKI